MIILKIALIIVFLIYGALAASIVYHLKTFALPGDRSMITITAFIIISLALGAVVIFLFTRVPWEEFNPSDDLFKLISP